MNLAMKSLSTIEQIDKALSLANALATKEPDDRALQSIIKQLEYLKGIWEAKGSLAAVPKGKMTLGVIAAKEEYDTNYPELANLLHDISWTVNQEK